MSFGVLDGDGQVAQIEGHPFGRISFTGSRSFSRARYGSSRAGSRSCFHSESRSCSD